MFFKTKIAVNNYILPNLRDVRFLGLIVFTVIAVLTSWSGLHIIEVNYELQKEISALDATNQVKSLENENLKLKNQYLNTDTYLELRAREQYSKGKSGEKLLLVPKEVALSHAPAMPQKNENQNVKIPEKSNISKNLEAWKQFYFHTN